jgi:hypothetical protein
VRKEDMILISVDDHIVQPPDMFVDHLPARYADDAPRLVHRDDGTDMRQFRGTVIPNVALNAVAGHPEEEYGLEPQDLDGHGRRPAQKGRGPRRLHPVPQPPHHRSRGKARGVPCPRPHGAVRSHAVPMSDVLLTRGK